MTEMVDYQRFLKLKEESRQKSLLLFGPRQTGKTYLLKKLFPKVPFYNLLRADTFLKVSQRPQIIREELLSYETKCPQPIIIDEIQKLPVLLDEVHYLIEEKGYHFILTGSSPRKLKGGAADLLGGRAWTRHLFPLVTREIPDYDLNRILNYGAIPSIYNSAYPEKDLAAYVGNYLREEIQAEGLVRKIENFSRFLQTASLFNTELVNFANIASDAGVPARTVAEYFSILQDTLIGHLLEPFVKSKKRKAISTAKFYFFDVGVCNVLAGRKEIRPKTELFGKTLEHFIFTELKAYLSYAQDTRPLNFWRSKSGYEVDFLIGDDIAIEVKATEMVTERHLSGLKALSEEMTLRKKIIISMDQSPRRLRNVDILPVKIFLQRLWSNVY
ncbi:MAG: ATP-binding protein [Candidatus Omnitrophica bacterium]|nr:ATP-binding protein [Candidatus Omnitrophota bacterium]